MNLTQKKKDGKRHSEKMMAGSTAQIREVVQRLESKAKHTTPGKQVRKVLRVLKKKDKRKSSRRYWKNITMQRS